MTVKNLVSVKPICKNNLSYTPTLCNIKTSDRWRKLKLSRSPPELNSEQRRHEIHKIQEISCQTVEDTPRGRVSVPQKLFSSTKETQSGGFHFVS